MHNRIISKRSIEPIVLRPSLATDTFLLVVLVGLSMLTVVFI